MEGGALAALREYLVEALRQLRLALGTGVVFYGFDVRAERASGLLQISPGLAFDGGGRAVALDQMLTLPLPDERRPLWLALRYHALTDGSPMGTRDSVEVVWLGEAPRDDETIPIARLLPGPAGWTVDRSVARRAPSLAHRHTGATLPDRSGRLRYDGMPVRLSATPESPAADEGLARLEAAATAEFAKVSRRFEELAGRLSLQGLEVEELRAEVAETAERVGAPETLATLREELALTTGEEVREELDLLRAEVGAIAARPAGVGADLGAFTPVLALRGVGEAFAASLAGAGIETVSDLLVAAANPEARARVEQLGVSPARLRRWSHEADLLRLHGAGPNEVALLDAAGIEGTARLATEDPVALYDRLRGEAAARGDLAPPALSWVVSWVEQARQLPPVVEW